MADRVQRRRGRRRIDAPRAVALQGLIDVDERDAYANLIWPELLASNDLDGRDAAFATELFFGACRMRGSYDEVITAASGRQIDQLDVTVRNILRLGAQQIFAMRVPQHAAVSTTVELAGVRVGEKVTGLVNAIIRKLAAKTWPQWTTQLYPIAGSHEQLAFQYGHPLWIVAALAAALHSIPFGPSADQELACLLAANNVPATPMLVVRPGLCSVDELVAAGAEPARWSPWGAARAGSPSEVVAVQQGRAGVQDEGSQLVVQAAVEAAKSRGIAGPWLDMCSGPGGKSALLQGLAPDGLLSAELQAHRARLVAAATRAYPDQHAVITADGTLPAWPREHFALVLADVPCTGLGALRRRPESRWRRTTEDLKTLVTLQRRLLTTALDSVAPGGVVAYVTCSPHPAETVEIVADLPEGYRLLNAPSFIPQVPDAASALNPACIQLMTHRHQSDAMFCALIARE